MRGIPSRASAVLVRYPSSIRCMSIPMHEFDPRERLYRVRLSDEQHRQLKVFSARAGVTLEELVTSILAGWLSARDHSDVPF